jgi:hypothetical protein
MGDLEEALGAEGLAEVHSQEQTDVSPAKEPKYLKEAWAEVCEAEALPNGSGGESTEGEAPKPYSVRSFAEIAQMPKVEVEEIWGGLTLSGGEVMEVVGPPGIGKSRIMLNLAVNQVLGRKFGNHPVLGRPLRWLFLGSENSLARWQYDIKRMSSVLTADERGKLANIDLTTLEAPDDTDISLKDEANVKKWRATICLHRPDVIVVDPFGDTIAGKGDALSEADARETIRLIRSIGRAKNEKTAIILVNHSRMGTAEMAKAGGLDGGNFGKNNKSVYSQARSVWNLRPGDDTDKPPVEMIHAKNNNGKRLPPFALVLDSETMFYSVAEGFEHEAWQAELEARAGIRSGGGPRKGASPLELEKKLVMVADFIRKRDEPSPRTKLTGLVRTQFGVPKSAAEWLLENVTRLDECRKPEFGIERFERPYPKACFIGTAKQLEKFRNPELDL